MVNEVIIKVKDENLVKGFGMFQKQKKSVVWRDASSIVIGTVLEVDGRVFDASWLKNKDDFSHINVADLESVLKGVNLVLKWELHELEVETD